MLQLHLNVWALWLYSVDRSPYVHLVSICTGLSRVTLLIIFVIMLSFYCYFHQDCFIIGDLWLHICYHQTGVCTCIHIFLRIDTFEFITCLHICSLLYWYQHQTDIGIMQIRKYGVVLWMPDISLGHSDFAKTCRSDFWYTYICKRW